MKKILTYCFLFFVTCDFLTAQQSLFNVPGLTVTKNKEFFFQEQANITGDGVVVNFNTAYGLGKGFEIGVNLIGMGIQFNNNGANLLTYYSNARKLPFNPLVMLTGLKRFQINKNFSAGIGTQVGFNPVVGQVYSSGIANFNYLEMKYELPDYHLMFVGGLYASNRIYTGQGDLFGPMVGFEYAIIEHKLLIMADWIIGKNSISVAVPGFVYHPHHNVALSLGWQLTSPGAGNPSGLVFELTIGNFSSK